MGIENKLGIVGTIKQEGQYLWQRIRRGYSDRQAAQWRLLSADIITPTQIILYRWRAWSSFSSRGPLILGEEQHSQLEYYPSSDSEWATHISSLPDSRIRNKMALEAYEKLVHFGLLARERRSIGQLETQPRHHP